MSDDCAAIPADTGARTAFVAAAVFAMTAAFVLVKTGRDALFFQGRGLFDLPFAYMGMAILSVPMAFVMLGLMRRLGPRRARIAAPLFIAALLLLASPFVRPGGGLPMTVFFLSVPLAFGVLFSLFWLLAADLLEDVPHASLASAYGRVGAASISGGMTGGLLARLLAPHLDPRGLIAAGSVTLALAALVVARAQAAFPARLRLALRGAPAPRLADLLRHRYASLLLATGMTAALVGMLVDFQFYLAAAAAGQSGRENAAFFADVYLVLNGAALVIQLWLLPWVQRAAGVTGSLLVLPSVLVGGAAALLAAFSVALPSLVRITEGGVRSSIHRVSWEQAFLGVDSAQRAAAKLLVDGAGARVAEGIAAAVMFAWLRLFVGSGSLVGRDTSFFAYLLLAASAAWVALTRVLGRRMGPAGETRAQILLPDT